MSQKDLKNRVDQAEIKYRRWVENKKQEIIEKCTACGACTITCKGFKSLPQNVSGTPPDEINEAFLEILKTGKVPSSPEAKAALDFACACGGCEECKFACSEGVNPSELVRVVRYQLFDSGHTFPDYVLQAHRYVSQPYSTGQICFPSAMECIQWTPDERKRLNLVTHQDTPDHPEQKDVVVMASCLAAIMPDCLVASVDVLNALGISYVVFSPIDYCCGYPEANEGYIRGFLEKNLLLADDAGRYKPKQLVIGCPTCYEVYYTWLQKNNIVEYPFEVKETVQLFADRIDKLKPKFKRSIDRVITVQDSCHIGRCSGEYDAQRKVLQAIPGVKMVEMKHSKDRAICCGPMDFIFDDRGWSQRRMIFEEAKEAGADAIMTICHMCNRTLSPLEDEYGIEVINYNTLLGQALGHDYDKKFHRYIKMDPDEVMKAAQREIEASPFGKEATEAMAKEYITRWGLRRIQGR